MVNCQLKWIKVKFYSYTFVDQYIPLLILTTSKYVKWVQNILPIILSSICKNIKIRINEKSKTIIYAKFDSVNSDVIIRILFLFW